MAEVWLLVVQLMKFSSNTTTLAIFASEAHCAEARDKLMASKPYLKFSCRRELVN